MKIGSWIDDCQKGALLALWLAQAAQADFEGIAARRIRDNVVIKVTKQSAQPISWKCGVLIHIATLGTQRLVSFAIKLLEQDKKPRKSAERRGFTKKTKLVTLIKQQNRCEMCGGTLEFPEFDHIDGRSSNNSPSNCQALCPNCHARKTRGK